jgi:hypothetical protein
MDILSQRTRARPGWAPTHRVPENGVPAWPTPDGSGPPAATLDATLDLTVVERLGDWERVRAVNGWTGWVDARLLVPIEGRARSPYCSGDWRVLTGGFDGLQVGDDITVEVDDDWVSLDSDSVAIDLALDEVRLSGDGSEVRLDVVDGRSVVLDWWGADDGDRLRDALRRSAREADRRRPRDARPITALVVVRWAYWVIGTVLIVAAAFVLLNALGGLAGIR